MKLWKNSYKMRYSNKEVSLKRDINEVNKELKDLKAELGLLKNDVSIAHYDFSNYDGISSEECKNKFVTSKE